MSDQSHGWGSSQTAPTRPGAAPSAGWYPDPWSRGHHRYWDGSGWTAGSFPHGPAPVEDEPEADPEGADATQTLPGPPPAGRDPNVPPPDWAAPASIPPWESPAEAPWAVTPAASKDRMGRMTTAEFVALIVAVMLVVGSVATLAGYYAFRHKTPSRTFLGPLPTLPSDPDAAVLQSLVLSQSDVPTTYVVQEIAGGDQVDSGDATLDLCNGAYPSESLRTARLQVAAFDSEGNEALSTEAVLYKNSAATAQAFSELRSVVAGCPSTPVVSPIGEATVTTMFNPPPDGSWPQTPTVDRQAYDFNSTDDSGNSVHSVAVYLRRGRVLMGVYFSNPDGAQVPVTGQDSIQAIVSVFAGRIAKLPASVVNK